MSTEAAAPARPYVGPTILLTLTQTMISWAVFAPPVIAKQALPEMGLDPIWIGAQPTVVFSAAMIVGVMASAWVARVNPMRATQLFVAFCVIGPILIATGSLVLVAVGSALIGAALGPATPASSHILGRVTPLHLRPLIFSIRQTGVTLGGVLAGFVTPLLVQLWDWQTAMLVIGGTCAVTAGLVEVWVRGYRIHADPTVERRAPVLAPVRLVLSIPAILLRFRPPGKKRWLPFVLQRSRHLQTPTPRHLAKTIVLHRYCLRQFPDDRSSESSFYAPLKYCSPVMPVFLFTGLLSNGMIS